MDADAIDRRIAEWIERDEVRRNHLGQPIVSKGRMILKKRGSTLDLQMKVIIVVCTLVKVYNMKKKTELIVTVVSITSLYF